MITDRLLGQNPSVMWSKQHHVTALLVTLLQWGGIPDSQWELKVTTRKFSEARKNRSNQVVIGFSFPSEWLSFWWEFFRSMTEMRKAKPVQSRFTFDWKIFDSEIQDCFGFALLCSTLIGLKKHAELPDQSDSQLKPFATWSAAFSCASFR